ncbi:universal stress protein [Amycolatopsis sp. NBRC 101858]|nr:universal stress protein [Amycolatopsis sp. NBRC 101858]
MRRQPSIVVGVDGAGRSHDALDWAAAEAAARGLPLRVVHAYAAASSWVAHSGEPSSGDGGDIPVMAGAVLAQAVRRVRRVASDLDLEVRSVAAAGAPAMLAQCGDAELLVLGGRRLSGLRGLLGGSTGSRVVMHSTCPVVVVRPMRASVSHRSVARVVAGIDGTGQSERVLEFAVRAAAQRGLTVTAVHAWTRHESIDITAVTDDWSLSEAAAWQSLQGVFARWRRQVAGVHVGLRLIEGRAPDVLVGESSGAALVVVGSRGRSSVRAALLGSVSQAVLQRANCPVAVVRTQ